MLLGMLTSLLLLQPAGPAGLSLVGADSSVRCIEAADGRVVGLEVLSESEVAATVLFAADRALTAEAVLLKSEPPILRLTGFAGLPGVDLGETALDVELGREEPYPHLRLSLEVRSFEESAWRAAYGETPFHLLALPLPGAEIFHQRGWPIPTPRIDPYPMRLAEDGGRMVASAYSPDWTYAPPLGAYPVPVAGLWQPSAGRYVAYDFHVARLRDREGDDVATAYCNTGEYLALVVPFPSPYDALAYPSAGGRWRVSFDLLHTREIHSDDDPNLFVTERAWQRFHDELPAAPEVMDLSWYPAKLRLAGFADELPGGLVARAGPNAVWEEPGAVSPSGVGHTSQLRFAYADAPADAKQAFERDLAYLLAHTTWLGEGADRACFWAKPLEGEMARRFGPGVGTLHSVQGWGVAQAILEYYLGTGGTRDDLLPYLDGALRYTREILYTRNDYPDVPAGQFAWGAAPAAHYCLSYYHSFRDDPARADLARLARKLARSMTYRYLAIWMSDNAPWDALDSTWFMEPNSGIPWLGAACANEVWVVPHALAEVYVETGDPILKQCLSGMLERWPVLAQEQYKDSIQAYQDEWAERYGLYPGSAQSPGTRAEYGGVWGGFEVLSWPVGGADVRILLGEGGALCFNAKGESVTLTEVRAERGGYTCRLAENEAASRPAPAGDLAVVVTVPFAEVVGGPVAVERDGRMLDLSGGGLEWHPSRPDTVTLRGLRVGDRIVIGAPSDGAVALACAMAKPREAEAEPYGYASDGLLCVELTKAADTALPGDWDDPSSYAGLHGGEQWVYGVRFRLIDPAQNGGRCAVSQGRTPAPTGAVRVYALVTAAEEGATLLARAVSGAERSLPVSEAPLALRGWPPIFGWQARMVTAEMDGPIASVEPRGCLLLAVTGDVVEERDRTRAEAEMAVALAAERAKSERDARIAALGPLFARHSGRVGVLPVPNGLGQSRLPKLLSPVGLDRHIRVLTPPEAASRDVLRPARTAVLISTGGETYYRTARVPGDCFAALQGYLAAGGMLVLLPAQPLPFCYSEQNVAVGDGARLGLPLGNAWETPPADLDLEWRAAPGQTVFPGLPETFAWSSEPDPRFRPMRDPMSADVRYTPLLTLVDRKSGTSYGEGAALLEFVGGPLEGGRVLYVWSSLQQYPVVGELLFEQALRYALESTVPAPAEVVAPRASQPPTIDGIPDEPIWRATKLPINYRVFTPLPADTETTAHVAWDADCLYLAFDVTDADIWATKTERDSDLFTEEVVEAFVDPDGDGLEYREFEVNPLGTLIDLLIPAPAPNWRGGDWTQTVVWNARGWRSAVHVRGTVDNRDDTDQGWTAEWAIPWSDLGIDDPAVGRGFRMGLFRCEAPKEGETEYLSWSPARAFHAPLDFGFVTLGLDPWADDFASYPEGATELPGWQPALGAWRVNDGALVGEDSGGDSFRATGIARALPEGDCTVRFRFRLDSVASDWRDGLWLGLRASEQDDYTLMFTARNVALHRTVRGSSTTDGTTLATGPYRRDGDWHTLAVRLEGARIVVTLDGATVLDAVDPARPEGRPAGANLVLSARKWTQSSGATRVRIDDLRIDCE